MWRFSNIKKTALPVFLFSSSHFLFFIFPKHYNYILYVPFGPFILRKCITDRHPLPGTIAPSLNAVSPLIVGFPLKDTEMGAFLVSRSRVLAFLVFYEREHAGTWNMKPCGSCSKILKDPGPHFPSCGSGSIGG